MGVLLPPPVGILVVGWQIDDKRSYQQTGMKERTTALNAFLVGTEVAHLLTDRSKKAGGAERTE